MSVKATRQDFTTGPCPTLLCMHFLFSVNNSGENGWPSGKFCIKQVDIGQITKLTFQALAFRLERRANARARGSNECLTLETLVS